MTAKNKPKTIKPYPHNNNIYPTRTQKPTKGDSS